MNNILEHDDTIRCYHCGSIVTMNLIGRDVSTWDEGEEYVGVEEWSFYMCPICKEPTLICRFWQQKGKVLTSEVGKSVAFPPNLFSNKVIPEKIRDAIKAASEAKSVDDIAIGLIAWRRVIELICNDLHAVGSNLYDKIDDLSKKNIFPSTINDASNLIRNLGNDGAHPNDIDVSIVSIHKIEYLVQIIVEYVYVLPQQIKAISTNVDSMKYHNQRTKRETKK